MTRVTSIRVLLQGITVAMQNLRPERGTVGAAPALGSRRLGWSAATVRFGRCVTGARPSPRSDATRIA